MRWLILSSLLPSLSCRSQCPSPHFSFALEAHDHGSLISQTYLVNLIAFLHNFKWVYFQVHVGGVIIILGHMPKITNKLEKFLSSMIIN